MTSLVTHDKTKGSCEATGHPSECTEPVTGTIDGSSNSITVENSTGDKKSLATKNSTLHFDTHSHDYSVEDGCHNNQSHDLTGDDLGSNGVSSSITINQTPVLIVENDVATDPVTGSAVNIVSSGINNSLTQ